MSPINPERIASDAAEAVAYRRCLEQHGVSPADALQMTLAYIQGRAIQTMPAPEIVVKDGDSDAPWKK